MVRCGHLGVHKVRSALEMAAASCIDCKQAVHCNFYRLDTLDRFAVLNVQFQHLSAQLRPLAKHYIAHPKVGRSLLAPNVSSVFRSGSSSRIASVFDNQRALSLFEMSLPNSDVNPQIAILYISAISIHRPCRLFSRCLLACAYQSLCWIATHT